MILFVAGGIDRLYRKVLTPVWTVGRRAHDTLFKPFKKAIIDPLTYGAGNLNQRLMNWLTGETTPDLTTPVQKMFADASETAVRAVAYTGTQLGIFVAANCMGAWGNFLLTVGNATGNRGWQRDGNVAKAYGDLLNKNAPKNAMNAADNVGNFVKEKAEEWNFSKHDGLNGLTKQSALFQDLWDQQDVTESRQQKTAYQLAYENNANQNA